MGVPTLATALIKVLARRGARIAEALRAQGHEPIEVYPFATLRLLGLLEIREFAPWVTAALLDIPQAKAEELMDTLVDLHLLDVAGRDASGRLRYRFHDLLRAYARELVAVAEPENCRFAALDRAFGGWLALAEEAGRTLADSSFAGTPVTVTCWRPEESVVRSVLTDPAGWFEAEWAALMLATARRTRNDGREGMAPRDLGMALVPVRAGAIPTG